MKRTVLISIFALALVACGGSSDHNPDGGSGGGSAGGAGGGSAGGADGGSDTGSAECSLAVTGAFNTTITNCTTNGSFDGLTFSFGLSGNNSNTTLIDGGAAGLSFNFRGSGRTSLCSCTFSDSLEDLDDEDASASTSGQLLWTQHFDTDPYPMINSWGTFIVSITSFDTMYSIYGNRSGTYSGLHGSLNLTMPPMSDRDAGVSVVGSF